MLVDSCDRMGIASFVLLKKVIPPPGPRVFATELMPVLKRATDQKAEGGGRGRRSLGMNDATEIIKRAAFLFERGPSLG